MKRTKKIDPIILALFAFIFTILLAGSGAAQTTAFIYQGKLTDAGNLANGNYDMQFKLFDTATVGTGTQQGSTITNPTVQVTAGNFTVTLDFGANVFDGTARFLEIGVRPAGSPNPHTILAPRQQLTSSPYAIQTLNATQLGGLPASRYVATDTNGNVGIGTSSPSTRLDVVNPATQLRFGPSTADNGGYLISTAPSQAIIAGGAKWNGANWIARDTVASITAHGNGMIQFNTNSGLSVGSPFVPTERMRIDSEGNVGIGTANPQSRLTVQAFSPAYGITHTDGTVTVGSYIDATGGWFGTRSNHPLHFFTNDSTPRMTLDTSGNLGIGSSPSQTRLFLSGGPHWTSANWMGSLGFQNSSAIGWAANAAGNRFGIGQSNAGLYFFRTSSDFGNTANPPIYDLIINDAGNLSIGGNALQVGDKGGFVKAMVFVLANGTISRCYNGTTGASTPETCGFSVSSALPPGSYTVNFGPGINIPSRFITLTTSGDYQSITGRIANITSTSVIVHTFRSDVAFPDAAVVSDFFLIIF